MSHWYDKDGQLIETDLREARKLKLAPSVNEIIHEFDHSVGLDIYKAKQMFMASLTLPRPKGISDDDYFELVKKDSEQHSENAKNIGIEFHYLIKKLLQGENWTVKDLIPKYKRVQETYNWIKQNKDSVIIDFKTQETKNEKFKQPYNSWLFQLCGYKLNSYYMKFSEYIEYQFKHEAGFGGTIDYAIFHGSLRDKVKLINIMISSNEDIPIKVYEWKQDKIDWGLKVFQSFLKSYIILKKLDYLL